MSLKLFFPEEKRNLFWLLFGPILLLCSALALLSSYAPLQTFLLFVGTFLLLVSYFAPKRVAQFSLGATAFFALYCLRGQESPLSAMEVLWTVQFLLALFVAQQTIFASKEYSQNASTLRSDLEEDSQLWRSRFDTLREKIESDREVWEAEIDAAKQEAEEKNGYAESLRRLVETAHAQVRKIEESPKQADEFDEMAMLKDKRTSLLSTIDHMATLKDKEATIYELQNKLEKSTHKDQEIERLEQLLAIAREKGKSISASELREKEEKIEELEELLQIVEDESDTIVVEGKEITQEGVMKMLTQLNEAREQNYQLELLLANAKEKYEELENAFESRRTRNHELLTTNKEKPITLQSLSKKAKR